AAGTSASPGSPGTTAPWPADWRRRRRQWSAAKPGRAAVSRARRSDSSSSRFAPYNIGLFPWPKVRAGVGLPPVIELPAADRAADVGHQPLEESNIMHRQQHRAKHLAREKKVANRAAG